MHARESQLTGRLRLRHLQEVTEAKAVEMESDAPRFNRLAGDESKPKVFSAFNLFPTPKELAARVVALADIRAGHSVLEPSAGTGNLIRAIDETFTDTYSSGVRITAVEIDGPMWHHLSNSDFCMFTNARLADFLTWESSERFDRIVMNPPFKQGRDIKHINRARQFLKAGGRLVVICANGPRQREKLQPEAAQWIELPAGSFKSEGTNVNAAIAIFTGE